jgi:polysaccharide deacetylase family protein (PEP-CTERM system associated)
LLHEIAGAANPGAAPRLPEIPEPGAGESLLLTFDVEDWRPLADEWVSGVRTQPSGRLPLQLEGIRRLLDQAGVRATFFWLGYVAELYPGLVKALAADGHEIASHGYSHTPLTKLTPEGFEADLRRAHDTLASLVDRPPVGFRAPQFSINRKTWWAFETLARNGYAYDSSIFPIRHRRYGVPDFGRTPSPVHTSAGDVWELPLATLQSFGINLPVAGGGYFRLLPLPILRFAVRNGGGAAGPFTTYFHPYEFDPEPLRVSVQPEGLRRSLRTQLFQRLQNLRRTSLPPKVRRIIPERRTSTCKALVAELVSRRAAAI